ncbi:MAG: YdeI/OmpD-associated family protein [Saprospiraceae bacterium]
MADAITFTGAIIEKNDDVLGYNGKLFVDTELVERMAAGNKGSKRIIVSVAETIEWHAAFIPGGKGDYFIIVNKERVKALRQNVSDLNNLTVTLLPDESDYGMPMPVELGELLAMDNEADKYFHALTPGKMRALMYLVAKPKREETRLKKAVGITTYLTEVRGKLDFAEMNAWLMGR